MKIRIEPVDRGDLRSLQAGGYNDNLPLRLGEILELSEEDFPDLQAPIYTADIPMYILPRKLITKSSILLKPLYAPDDKSIFSNKPHVPVLAVEDMPHKIIPHYSEVALSTYDSKEHNDPVSTFLKEVLSGQPSTLDPKERPPLFVGEIENIYKDASGSIDTTLYGIFMEDKQFAGFTNVKIRFENISYLKQRHKGLMFGDPTGWSKVYQENDALIIDFTQKDDEGVFLYHNKTT